MKLQGGPKQMITRLKIKFITEHRKRCERRVYLIFIDEYSVLFRISCLPCEVLCAPTPISRFCVSKRNLKMTGGH